MRRAILCLPLLAVVLMAACGGSNKSSPTATAVPATNAAPVSTPTSTATAVPSPTAAPSPTQLASASRQSGCGNPLPSGVTPGKTSVRTIVSGAVERSYRLHVPAGGSNAKPLALVLNFHGLGSSALEQELYSGLVPVSDREGFVLVSPDGQGAPRSWASFAQIPTGVDDVQFTRDLLDALTGDLCIDASRVFATGMSNGAFMSSRLGCVLSDRIAAVAPVSGIYYPLLDRCGAPTPLLAIHGTADDVVPFEKGLIFSVLPYPGARAGAASWAAHNGCAATSKSTTVVTGVTRESFDTCKADTELLVVEGGGHTWPGAIEVARLGSTNRDLNAAETIWAFFAAHPRKP